MPKAETSLNELLYDIRRVALNREKLSNRKIKAIYSEIVDELDSFLAKGYKQYADAEGRLYLSALDAQRKRAWFLNEIVKAVDGHHSSIEKAIGSLITNTYTECYKGMAEAVQNADTDAKLAKVAKDIDLNPNTLKQVANNSISKLTLPPLMQKHRGEIIYQIQQELMIGLANGDRYETMAKRITERCNVSESKAMNITRTETHRNIEAGMLDCAERLGDGLEEYGMIYAATWETMEDERVRPQQRQRTKNGWKTTTNKSGANHQKMHGVTVKAGEPFDLGDGITTKAPGQSGHAMHDCRCRCVLVYKLMTLEEFAEATGRKINELGQAYSNATVPGKMDGDFSDFQELTLTDDEEKALLSIHGESEKTGNECAIILTKNGTSGIITSGVRDGVGVDISAYKDNVTLLHSHTNDTPLSAQDFAKLLNSKVEKIGSIAHNKDVYLAYVGSGWVPTDKEYAATVSIISGEVMRDIAQAPDFLELTEAERNYVFCKEQAYRIARHFEWTLEGGKLDESF